MAEKPTYEELTQRIQALEKSESRRKRAEKALKESEAYLRTLIRTIPDLVWLKDPQGIYLFCNSRFESFFGAKENEIIGKTDYDFVDKDQADFFRRHDKLAISKGKPSKNEEEVVFAADGHREFLETIKTPIFRDDGRLIGVLGIGRDITERKRAEGERLANLHFLESLDKVNQALQGTGDLERMMRDVLDIILAIFCCDRAFLLCPGDAETSECRVPMERTRPEHPGVFELGVSLPMTPQVKAMFQELFKNRSILELRTGKGIDPEQEPWKQFNIQSMLAIALFPKIGKPWQFGLHQCTHPRQWTPREKTLFQEISRRLTDGLTNLLMYRELEKMVEDRTAQLKVAQDGLVKKEKLSVLGQLTTVVSHELRNPLGVIRTSAFFLQRHIKSRDEKIDKHFKRIDAQISHCDAIVADLLEYTRGRNAEMSTKDLTPWLTQVVNQLEEQFGIGIGLHVAANLPHVPHDQEKMQRAIINLLTNAVQAVQAVQARAEGEHGPQKAAIFTPRIMVELGEEKEGLSITVSDNGTGMEPETRLRAFEPLFTTRPRGTGIGLAIVKKTVEEHQGTIHLESRPGEGTRITLTLPRAKEPG